MQSTKSTNLKGQCLYVSINTFFYSQIISFDQKQKQQRSKLMSIKLHINLQ